VAQKTILLVDDEQMFLEALEDALLFDGYRVLKARDVATALHTLRSTQVDLITIDIMLSPGRELEGLIKAQNAGFHLCRQVAKSYPKLPAYCLSVVNDGETIDKILRMGIGFLRKGETPLRTVLQIIKNRLDSTDAKPDRRRSAAN
jgi:DNA-binding NarL/FixJ family response regulator